MFIFLTSCFVFLGCALLYFVFVEPFFIKEFQWITEDKVDKEKKNKALFLEWESDLHLQKINQQEFKEKVAFLNDKQNEKQADP